MTEIQTHMTPTEEKRIRSHARVILSLPDYINPAEWVRTALARVRTRDRSPGGIRTAPEQSKCVLGHSGEIFDKEKARKEAFALHRLKGWSYRQIAEQFRICEKTAQRWCEMEGGGK